MRATRPGTRPVGAAQLAVEDTVACYGKEEEELQANTSSLSIEKPLLPLCPTALYHAMLWYTPSMRTRVPSFGQTFPNLVGPCQKKRSTSAVCVSGANGEAMEQAAAPAAAAAPPVDIFKLVADKVLEQDQERDAVAGVESELLFVGAKNSGKSTLIHSFLSKEEAPKPTSALEYRFARRSTGEDKAVANIWELGGGSQLRCAGCCTIPLCCPCTARLAPIDLAGPLCPQPTHPPTRLTLRACRYVQRSAQGRAPARSADELRARHHARPLQPGCACWSG